MTNQASEQNSTLSAMAYATFADMVARFGDLEVVAISDVNNQGFMDKARLKIALEDATAEINGYLTRYQLPFKSIPRELVRICCDIAHYRLCGINNAVLSDEIIKRYDRNIAWLKSVATGTVSLHGVVNDNDGKNDDSDAVQFKSTNTVFGR